MPKNNGIKNYKSRINLKLEIRETINRLENDVGGYLQFLKQNNFKFGYFAMIRLLFPIIEHTMELLPQKNGFKNQSLIYEKLGLPFPKLIRYIFRNALAHADAPETVYVGNKVFSWSLSFKNNGHKISKSKLKNNKRILCYYVVNIDLINLYINLLSLLKEIEGINYRKKYLYISNRLRIIQSHKNNIEVIEEIKKIESYFKDK